MFTYNSSIFLTSTALNKDIFSCKAKSRRVILSVAYAKSNCGAVRGIAEQDLGREYHPFPSQIPMLRIALRVRLRAAYTPSSAQDDTRGDTLPFGRQQKALMEITYHKCLCVTFVTCFESLIKAYEALLLWTQMQKYGIPLSRYTVFLKNCPLERRSNGRIFFAVCSLYCGAYFFR